MDARATRDGAADGRRISMRRDLPFARSSDLRRFFSPQFPHSARLNAPHALAITRALPVDISFRFLFLVEIFHN